MICGQMKWRNMLLWLLSNPFILSTQDFGKNETNKSFWEKESISQTNS